MSKGKPARSLVVSIRRAAYTGVIGPALLLAAGCAGEAPEPPAGAPTEEDAQFEAPNVDLGAETQSTTEPGEQPQGSGSGGDSSYQE